MNSIMQTAIEAQLESNEQFPVDFDMYREWLEYFDKSTAKRAFLNCGFVEGVDFEVGISAELRPQGGFSNREIIKLTIECAKMFAMMCKTEKGKEVRQYYIDCERRLKSKLSNTGVSAISVSTPTYTDEWYRLQEAKATCELADLIWGKSPIDELLKSGVKANIVSKSHPVLKPACEEMKTLLPMPIKAQLVTVTGIAELLTKESGVSFSARSLNTFLTNNGFQTRDVGREPPYMPTEKGKDFSEIVLQVANGCEKAVHQLRWFTTLVDELLPLVLSSPNGK